MSHVYCRKVMSNCVSTILRRSPFFISLMCKYPFSSNIQNSELSLVFSCTAIFTHRPTPCLLTNNYISNQGIYINNIVLQQYTSTYSNIIMVFSPAKDVMVHKKPSVTMDLVLINARLQNTMLKMTCFRY